MAELIDKYIHPKSGFKVLGKIPIQMALTFCWVIYQNVNSAMAYNLWG